MTTTAKQFNIKVSGRKVYVNKKLIGTISGQRHHSKGSYDRSNFRFTHVDSDYGYSLYQFHYLEEVKEYFRGIGLWDLGYITNLEQFECCQLHMIKNGHGSEVAGSDKNIKEVEEMIEKLQACDEHGLYMDMALEVRKMNEENRASWLADQKWLAERQEEHQAEVDAHNAKITTQIEEVIEEPVQVEDTTHTTTTTNTMTNVFDHYTIDELPTFLLAFSGGKDSIACFLHLLDLGIPRSKIILHHHEVDGGGKNLWDWRVTNQYCEAFAREMDVDLLFSRRDGGITREIFRSNEGRQPVSYQREVGGEYITLQSRKGSTTRQMFPALSMDLNSRWCSEMVKISVMARAINNNPDYATGNFVVVTGERREESAKRSKYDEIEMHRCNSSKRITYHWKPVIDWTEQEVWDKIEQWSIQCHPCYELGWGRCSCQTCIFGSADIWAAIAEISPEKVDAFEMIEQLTGHTQHTKKVAGETVQVPIREKVAAGTSVIPSDIDREYWITQATKCFYAPIIKPVWSLPAGAFKESSCGA